MSKTKIYRAKKIITMNHRRPVATHVAVRDGWILGTGTLEDLAGWGDYDLDEQFADKIIMPGFVEGHCHSWEGSAWDDTFLGYFDRMSPKRVLHKGVKNIDEMISRLQEAERATAGSTAPVKGWCLDPIYFGGPRVVAGDLDKVSTERPVLIMHQSGHIVNINTKLMQMANITRDTDVQGLVKDENGEPTGELMGPALYNVAYHAAGLNRFLDMGSGSSLWSFAHSAIIAGVTTATDLANELPPSTVESQAEITASDDYPLRIVPAFLGMSKPADEGAAYVHEIKKHNNDRLRYGLVKLVADGSIQGFTARLKWPGYYNNARNGLWYIDPDEMPTRLGTYHEAGHQVHIHTNGDQATENTINSIEMVLRKKPDPDARFTLQHCQMAHDAHFRRMARLGICANLFANHVYYYGDQHIALTMGPERAERIDACNTAGRLGVNYAIHSDAPVTHLGPLFTAWCAVNRQTASGKTLGHAERISVDDALYAITLGAAYTLKLDSEIGSIETGKRADFAILDDDPQSVDPMTLKDVAVWGTVLGGRVFPCEAINSGV